MEEGRFLINDTGYVCMYVTIRLWSIASFENEGNRRKTGRCRELACVGKISLWSRAVILAVYADAVTP